MESPTALKALFEDRIAEIREQEDWSGTLYAPMAYILRLGGKRVRPMLLLLTYQALSGRSAAEALNAAAAVELFHNFTLIHDDIMDNAPKRRNQPTVHEKWDVNTAILAGDAMFAVAVDYMVRDFPEKAGPLTREFMRVSVGVCEGQMEDMDMAEAEGASIAEYIEMIRKKTAMLIGGAMSIGAIAAGALPGVVRDIYAYGEAVGIGFQLQDDYLDVYAEQAKFGKQVAGDILENKKTFLLIRAMEKSSPAQSQRLEQLLFEEADDQRKIAGVKAIYAELDIPAETRAHSETYFNRADALSEVLSTQPGFAQIDTFLQALMKREY
ncbi:MAG: polyprenyl synthetase family protein [Bacteroidota bacterium]